jgi:hypothetical protein
VPLPAQALDHATGYLLAAAICRGLSGRYDGMAPADLRGALVGTANLLMGQSFSRASGSSSTIGSGSGEVDLGQATVLRDTFWGPVRAVPQPGTIGGTAGRWRVPAGPLGRDAASFTV